MTNILSKKYYQTYNIKRKYRNFRPTIIMDDVSGVVLYNLDKEIKILRLQTAIDNSDNRRWCYWAESTCRTFINLVASSIVGSGLRVTSKNKRAEEIINNYNKKINRSGMSMNEFIRYSLIDNAIDGFSVWRILKTREEPYIDIARLNTQNVVPIQHPTEGWVKFIYKDYLPDAPPSQYSFLSSSYRPPYDLSTKTITQTGQLYEWHIPLESTVFINLVSKPSMSAAMQYVIFKRWILWFMRKVAEKAWMPLIVGTIGNRENPFPLGKMSPEDVQKQLRSYAMRIARLSSFGILTKVYGEDLEILQDRTTSQARQQFVDQIRMLDEQIIFAMGGTLGFTGVEKSEIGDWRQKENMLNRSIQSLRSSYANKLELFYINVLLPEYGIHLKPGDVSFDWSHLKEDRNLEIAQMAAVAMEHGAISFKEYRKILKSIWDFIEIEDGAHLKDFEKYVEIQSRKSSFGSRPGNATNAANKKIQATRPYSQAKGAVQQRD